MIHIKSSEEILKMRKSGELLARTFRHIERFIRPEVSTKELNDAAEEFIYSHGGRPAFKGYRGFPASICTSIDSQVVHGIPGSRRLREGEIISIDIGVELDGYFADAAKTYAIGEISEEKSRLIDVTRRALYRGIKKCREGNNVSDISVAIQSYVESNNFNVVRVLVGHGIGSSLHEDPQVPNFVSSDRGAKLRRGMTIAIEPMVNMGSEKVKFLDDGWTVETSDGLPSAHFEHTVLITDGKPEILTRENSELEKNHG